MSVAATQHPPAIPPRPSRSHERDGQASDMPLIPPRPNKSRSKSPSMDRFASSPLNDNGFHSKSPHLKPSYLGSVTSVDAEEAIDRSGSVNMPSLGEEGNEYAAVTEELDEELGELEEAGSPGETRTVGDDVKLHAPKPSLPAVSAKQRVMAVTRTDSSQAASFGIGKPSAAASAGGNSTRTKSISSQGSGESHGHGHDERKHEIPEIGIQVPMLRDAGDVQAPTPANGNGLGDESGVGHFRTNSRGPPPGSYGMHGHGVVSDDKLDQAYYEKHPEKYKQENLVQLHERKHEFNMSSEDLNRIVRDTANRGSGLATHNFAGTPSEEVGFQASEEYATRIATPHRSAEAAAPGSGSDSGFAALADDDTIHIVEHNRSRSVGDSGNKDQDKSNYPAPILAPDEVQKNGSAYEMHAAVEPPPERSGSNYEMEKPTSTPSRPTSFRSTTSPLPSKAPKETKAEEQIPDDEPLFKEAQSASDDNMAASDDTPSARHHKHQFPSKDVWEDSPQSVHYTATVSTPEVDQGSWDKKRDEPAREDAETPQQAFARRFEALAEQEAGAGIDPFTDHRKPATPPAAQLNQEVKPQSNRPAIGHRFPSKDVWEDAPESHMYQTTVSTPQQEEEEPAPQAKPMVPSRPQPKPKPVLSGEHTHQKPPVSDRPKPQVPARPSKLSSSTTPSLHSEEAASKPKPAVPARLGGKIAALQAGFMSDLNKRLQIGPQAPKKEETPAQDAVEETKEKAPLSDARKGRARGPQRRAPGKSPAPAAAESAQEKPAEVKSVPSFSFSLPATSWAIDPDHGSLEVANGTKQEKAQEGEGVKEEAREEEAGEEKEPIKEEAKEVEAKEEEVAVEEEKPVDKSPQQSMEIDAQPEAKDEHSEEVNEPEPETKTLVSNMAGESILEADVVKKDGAQDQVEPVKVEDTVEP